MPWRYLLLLLLLLAFGAWNGDRNTLERVHKRGRFMRPASQRRLLQVHRDKILCVELRGELFFGSSQQLLQQARQGRGEGGGDTHIFSFFVFLYYSMALAVRAAPGISSGGGEGRVSGGGRIAPF